jgi:uncharacterized delta-60 repeat protein
MGTALPALPVGVSSFSNSSELIQIDGKIVLAGSATVAGVTRPAFVRLQTNGLVDTLFADSGYGFPVSETGVLRAVAEQSNGDLVAAGSAGSSIFVVRLSANGVVDPTFGVRNYTFGFGSSEADTVASILIQPDGKIVVAGSSGPGASASAFAALRIEADGTLDPTFGGLGNGRVVVPFDPIGQGFSVATAAALLPGGQVVLGGYRSSTFTQFAAVELNADGTLDTSFGSQGLASVPFTVNGVTQDAEARSLAVETDGSIVLAGPGGGAVGPDFAVARLTSAGVLDTSFGSNGSGEVDVSFRGIGLGLGSSTANSVVVLPNGKIMLGGSVTLLAEGSRTDAALARLLPSGSLDTTYGDAGLLLQLNPADATGSVAALAVQPNGKLVAALASSTPAVARYLQNSTPGDYNGDAIADPAVFINGASLFAYRPSTGGADVLQAFGPDGLNQVIPAPGDYEGIGRTDLAAYLPQFGAFVYRPSTGGSDIAVGLGLRGQGQAIPAPGDYDGSGKTEFAVYLPSFGAFEYLPSSGGPPRVVPFGIPGSGQSIPVPGDYDGSGRTEFAVYVPSSGVLAYRPANGGPDVVIPFGIPGAGQTIPVPGDYDGSGRTELAVYLPALGVFAYRPALGGPDQVVRLGQPGLGKSIPVPGDYQGVGRTEFAVYEPSLGALVIRPANGGPDIVDRFGIPGNSATTPATLPLITGELAAPSVSLPKQKK